MVWIKVLFSGRCWVCGTGSVDLGFVSIADIEWKNQRIATKRRDPRENKVEKAKDKESFKKTDHIW